MRSSTLGIGFSTALAATTVACAGPLLDPGGGGGESVNAISVLAEGGGGGLAFEPPSDAPVECYPIEREWLRRSARQGRRRSLGVEGGLA